MNSALFQCLSDNENVRGWNISGFLKAQMSLIVLFEIYAPEVQRSLPIKASESKENSEDSSDENLYYRAEFADQELTLIVPKTKQAPKKSIKFVIHKSNLVKVYIECGDYQHKVRHFSIFGIENEFKEVCKMLVNSDIINDRYSVDSPVYSQAREMLNKIWFFRDEGFATAFPLEEWFDKAVKLPASEFELVGESTDPIFLLWKFANAIGQNDRHYTNRSDLLNIIVHRLRDICTGITWSVPCPNTIEAIISRTKKIVDLGAGTGYWSAILKNAGAESVIAVDDQSDYKEFGVKIVKTFHPIINSDSVTWLREHAGEYDDHALFFSWARSDEMMEQCVDAWKGDYIFVICEGGDGKCTGDLDNYMENNSSWEHKFHTVPKWLAINDYLCIYTRVKTQVL